MRDAKAIFLEALERTGREELSRFLDEACDGDPALRARVEELLRAHRDAGSFLEPDATRLAVTVDQSPVTEGVGATIGQYKLLEQIGEGGFGVVFVAEQTEPIRRKVALKVLKPGMDTKQVVARFEAERQALALMDHPNIARVFDGGTTDSGRPYFVMELVKGAPITRYCDENHLSPRQRLELFVSVCQAVQHAHQKGIIHRDLKPGNVLVTVHDTAPVVKVIDFGIAKALGQELTDKTIFTGFAQMIGTPLYMSPEQAGQSGLDVDTRSDVYSLGVLLYELLTGSTPFTADRFKKAAYDEIRRIIREEEPPKPSTRLSDSKGSLPSVAAQRQIEPAKLTKLVRGELDWIVMKALEKDRNRRYETANGFAADLMRYLADEPVQACPPSLGYRLGKLLRRNRGLVLAASFVALALVIGLIGTSWGMIRATDEAEERGKAEQQAVADRDRKAEAEAQALKDRDRKAEAEALAKKDRDEAVTQKNRALDQRYASGVFPTSRLWREGNHLQVRRLLDALRPEPGESDRRHWEWHYQDRLTQGALRTLKGHYDGRNFGTVKAIAFSPDGRWLVSAGDGEREEKEKGAGDLRLWEVATGQEVRRFDPGAGGSRRVICAAFSPDGTTLASGDYWGSTVRLWDVASGQLLHTFDFHVGDFGSLAFSPDGTQLAATDKDGLKLWEVGTRRELGSWEIRSLITVAFHPEGHLLTVTPATVALHEPATGKVLRSLSIGTAGARPRPREDRDAAAVSADGRRLAVTTDDGIQLWDLIRGVKGRLLEGHARKDTNGLTFSPDGLRLASAGKDGAVEVWDLRDPTPRRSTHRILEGGVDGVAFGSDGLRLAAAGHDGAIRILDAGSTGQEARVFRGVAGRFGGSQVAFTPDGGQFVILPSPTMDGPQGMPFLCDAVSGQKLPGQVGGKGPVAYSPDGRWLVAGCKEGIRVWEAATLREVRTISMSHTCAKLTFVGNDRFVSVLYRLGSGGPETVVKVWDVATGQELATIPERAVVSPDGKRVAARGSSKPPQPNDLGVLQVWDVDQWRTGEEKPPVRTARPHSLRFSGLAYSPDGKFLTTAGVDEDKSESLKFWNAETLEEVRSIPWPKDVPFESLVFSPDGRYMAAGRGGRVKVWDLTGRVLFDYTGNDQDLKLVFSPNGRYLAASGSEIRKAHTLRVWEVTGREVIDYQRKWYDGQWPPRINVAFSPDESAVAVTNIDVHTVWDLATGRERFRLQTGHLPQAGALEAGIHLHYGYGAAFSPDGRTLATGSLVMRLWDATTGAELPTPGGPPGRVHSMAVSPVGRRVATGGEDALVRVWDPDGWKPLGTFERHRGAVSALAFSPDGHWLASDGGGELRVWDLTDLRAGTVRAPTHRLKGQSKARTEGPDFGLAFTPDSQRLVSVGADGSLKVWDAIRGQELSSAKLALGTVKVLTLSPNGQLLACGGEDNAVRVWDLSKGQELCVLTVDDKQRQARNYTEIKFVTFSPDGLRLAAIGMGTIRIWDVRTFQEVYTITPTGPLGALAFSPDGGRLVAVGGVGTSWSSTTTGLASGGNFNGTDNVVIYDGRPRTPEQQVEREAVALLDQLFGRPLSRKDVLDHQRVDPALSEPVRQTAMRLAAHFQEESDPKRYARAARLLARSAHLPVAAHRQALNQAEAACALAPADGDCLIALGMAQYRLGRYADALRTLTRAGRPDARRFGNATPAEIALLALVHHKLGNKDELRDLMEKMRQLGQNEHWKNEEEFAALRYEVELRINGTPPAWPKVEVPKKDPDQ